MKTTRKVIDGYENYDIDIHGNVHSKERIELTPNNPNMKQRTRRARVLKKMVDKKGYHRVHLYNNGKLKRAPVHRLVALAFIDRSDDSLVVNHIDNNPLNNSVDNLEWVTQYENVRHSIKQGRHSSQLGGSKKKVRHIATGVVYDSATEAAKEFGVVTSCITNHTRGLTKNKKWEIV